MSQSLNELLQRALIIKQKYAEFNALNGEKKWDASDYMAGFVGDVGELSKLLMAKKGLRSIENTDSKIEHELADCFWSVLVIADELNIDIEKSFLNTMKELDDRLESAK